MGIVIGAMAAAVLMAGCGAAVAWRLRRYPGGWGYAFGSAFASQRRELAAARRSARQLGGTAGREPARARADAKGAESRHRYEVELAVRRVERLRDPGRGELLLRLGVLALHQHAVVVGPEELPLARLTVRLEEAGGQYVLHFALPDGRVRRQVLAPTLHTGEEVRRFGHRVAKAVTEEQLLLKRRDQLVAAALAELRQVEQRLVPQRPAHDPLAEPAERYRADQRPAEARRALDDARARWHGLTGRHPS